MSRQRGVCVCAGYGGALEVRGRIQRERSNGLAGERCSRWFGGQNSE